MNNSLKNIIWLLILCLLTNTNTLSAEGFAAETLVKTAKGYTSINKLKIGDQVLCRNPDGIIVERPIIHITQKNSSEYTQILIDNQIITAACDQKFYLPQEKTWIAAQNLATSHILFDQSINCHIINTLCQVNQPITLYMISVEQYHNFYISTLDICVHNFLPAIFLGLSWAFGGGITFTGASAAIIATGLGVGIALSKKNDANGSTEIRFGSSDTCIQGLGGPDDDENKIITVNNMKEFFKKTEFGQKVESSVEKTNKVQQGQSVYQIKKDIPE